jgi:RNase P/RNase MRP subunit p29
MGERSPDAPSDALARELIGATVRIERAPGIVPLPVCGTIVDETMGTFLVRLAPSGRTRRFAKAGLEGTLLLGLGELPLKGDALRVRPEDRTKRLAHRGRRW